MALAPGIRPVAATRCHNWRATVDGELMKKGSRNGAALAAPRISGTHSQAARKAASRSTRHALTVTVRRLMAFTSELPHEPVPDAPVDLLVRLGLAELEYVPWPLK